MTAMITSATRITLVRIFLVPLFVGCLIYYEPDRDYLRWTALSLFTLGIVTDGLDGFMARTFSQHSPLGQLLDPLADKILLLAAFVSCSVLETLPESLRIPPWVTILVISRDAMIIVGTCLIFLLTQRLEIKPSRLGKATTFFQMATILAVLLQLSFRTVLWNVAMGLTIASGLGYLRYGSRLLNHSAP